MVEDMRVLDLFSGIGGFSLGLERAGMETVAFCEYDEKCRQVLKKHWPDVPQFSDVKNLTADTDGNLLYTDENGEVFDMVGKSNKYDGAVDLYQSGLSVGDCAEFYGITRQAMHNILKRRDCEFRPQHKYGADNHFHRGGKSDGQRRAGHLVEKAIKKGILSTKVLCEECEKPKVFKNGRSGIQAHHDDYSKPLEVRWLCQECHHEWHKTHKPKGVKVSAAKPIQLICGGYP